MNNTEKRILIIEDEQRMRHLLELVLTDEGYSVKSAIDGMEGMVMWQLFQPHVVVTDLKMPRADGLEILDFRNQQYQQVPLIILTAFGTVRSAVTAMKQGAFDYLTKPIDNEYLIQVIARAIRDTDNRERVSRVSDFHPDRMIGSSPVMKRVHEDIALVAGTRMSILITGESGTGKELVAKAIHAGSGRVDRPFIRVNCAAIPRDLLESELFGHCKGAFTGAINSRKGAFFLADGGTLFLDEIGDLPLELQPKLLHAVEEKSVTPVGSCSARTVDVKIIAATNRDLDQMVDDGLFRTDLYYRLNKFHFSLPPLRKRGKDLFELVEFFLDLFCRQQGHQSLGIDAESMRLLHNYSWPGNIRELRNVLERLVLTCRDCTITVDMLPEKILSGATVKRNDASDSYKLPVHEKQLILDALAQSGWNQSECARLLGVSRNTLRYRIRKYQINRT